MKRILAGLGGRALDWALTPEEAAQFRPWGLLPCSAPQNPCFAQGPLLSQEGAVSCLSWSLPAFGVEAKKGVGGH